MKKYIKANDYYGYDSNGDPIDESTVDELRSFVTYDILPFTELSKLGNLSLDEDSFKYTATGTAFGAYLDYTINLSTSDDEIDVYSFMNRSWNSTMVDFNDDRNYVNLYFEIHVKGDKINVEITDTDVYERGTYSEYYSKKFVQAFDIYRMCDEIKKIAEPAVREIKVALSNL